MESSIDLVKELDNDTLKSLLKEIHEIGKLDKPALAKYSPEMTKLFKSEKHEYNYWSDQYSNVSCSIQFQILHRIRTDIW